MLYLYCGMPGLLKKIIAAFLTFSSCVCSTAQDYSYIHYDVQNGLAGTNVYAVYQDRQKFLWFGTETGVSRFDGTNFKTFTANEGLPDNEILEIYGDESGRIWFIPFKKTICYYYNGKIYNQQNDSVLQKIQLHSNLLSVCGDKYQNTWLLEANGLYLITPEKTIRYFDKINNKPLSGSLFIGLNKNKELILQWQNNIYVYRNNGFHLLTTINYPAEYQAFLSTDVSGDYIVWRSGKNTACAQSLSAGTMFCFNLPNNTIRFSIPGNETISVNTTDGAIIYNAAARKMEYTFLKNISVSKVLIDHEGNWWFTTLGEGVYQLPSSEYKNYKPWQEGTNQEIFSLSETGNKIIMGINFGQLIYTSDFKTSKTVSLPHTVKNKYNRFSCISKTSSGKIIVGTDEQLAVFDKNLSLEKLTTTGSVKYIHYVNDDSILVATVSKTSLFSLNDFTHPKVVWNERSTAVCLYNHSLFIGTLNGLYHLQTGQLPVFMGKYDTLFSKRISAMTVSSDTTLWIATYNGGIIGFKNGKLTDTITTNKGLTSNICRNLTIYNDVLWAGTDKGLNRIDLKRKPYRVTAFTVSDGLLSNHINAVYEDNDTVFVASQDGVTYFDVTKINTTSQCNLEITNIYREKEELPVGDKYVFKHNQNNLKVDFVGISFKSAGDITYYYRLDGLDTAMKTTKQTSLEFLSLPPGNYILQLMAVNKFGVKSEVKKIAVTIEPAFYQTPWFYTLAVLAIAGVTLLFVLLYNRSKKEKETKERETIKRITELEQMALRSQMNPHFIFNCLNSIQQYVYDKDIQSANRFISGFAKLIRQTLDNSAKTTISVSGEADYLNSFLSLEKIRFENTFDYKITISPGINADLFRIPAMLLQPYVENCVRHGIRYKKDGTGKILVQFSLTATDLVCSIEDNGIGRKKAMELKSHQHIEYQSKGMLLTGERIDAINKMLTEKIRMEVIDLATANNEASGTEILIHFPLSLVQIK